MANEEDTILARLLQDRSGISAAQGGGYKPATVNFDWLGQLPQIADIAGSKRAREQTLANLPEADLSNPNTSYNIAHRLFAAGDFEGGNKFMAHGMKQEEIKQRGIDLANAQTILKNYPSGRPPETPKVPVEYVPEPVPRGGAAPAPSGPPVDWGPNPTVGPQGALSPGTLPPNAGMSPSDQLIAAAQAGIGGGPAPMQLAQAGGAPPAPTTAPTGAPGVPSWLSGVDIGTPRTTVPLGGAAPPAQAPITAQRPMTGGGEPGLAEQLQQKQAEMARAGLGGKYTGALRETLMTEIRNLTARAYPTDKEKQAYVNYVSDHIAESSAMKAAGVPDEQIPRLFDESTYKLWLEQQPRVSDAARKVAEDYTSQAKSSREVIQLMQGARAIMDNPRFMSGTGTEDIAGRIKAVSTWIDAAKALGVVPKAWEPNIDSIRSIPALRELLTSMTNSAVIARLHGLSQNVSNSDRIYTDAIFPTLMNSVAGNKLIAEYIQKVEEAKLRTSESVNSYMLNRHPKTNPNEIEAMVARRAASNNIVMDANGNLTDLGKRMMTVGGNPNIMEDIRKGIPPAAQQMLIGREAVDADGVHWMIRPGQPPQRLD